MNMQVEIPEEFKSQMLNLVKSVLMDSIEDITRLGDKDFLTASEVRERYSVSTVTLNRWVSELGLEKIQVDGKTYYDKNELDSFIRSHKI